MFNPEREWEDERLCHDCGWVPHLLAEHTLHGRVGVCSVCSHEVNLDAEMRDEYTLS